MRGVAERGYFKGGRVSLGPAPGSRTDQRVEPSRPNPGRQDFSSLSQPAGSPPQEIELSSKDVEGILSSLKLNSPLPDELELVASIKIVDNKNNSTNELHEADDLLRQILKSPSQLADLDPGSEVKLTFRADIKADSEGSMPSSLIGVPVTPFASIEGGAKGKIELAVLVENDSDLRVTATIGGGIEGSGRAGVRAPWINIPEPLKKISTGVSRLFSLKSIQAPKPLKRIIEVLMDDAPSASAGIQAEDTKHRSVVLHIPRTAFAFKELLSGILSGKVFSSECIKSLNPTRIESGSFSASGDISLRLPGDASVRIAENSESHASETRTTSSEKTRERLWDRVTGFLGGKREVRVKTGTVTTLETQGENGADISPKTCACVEISLSQHWRRDWHTLKAVRFLRALRPNCELLKSSEHFSLQPSSFWDRISGKDRAHQNINVVLSPEEVTTILRKARSGNAFESMVQSYEAAAGTIRAEKVLPPRIQKTAESFAENLSRIAYKTDAGSSCREPLETLFLKLSKDACPLSTILALKKLAHESNGQHPNPSVVSGQVTVPGLTIAIGEPTSPKESPARAR